MSKSPSSGKKTPHRKAVLRKPAVAAKGKRMQAEKSAPAQTLSREEQFELYDQAMGLFRAGRYAKAKEMFTRVTAGPNRAMAHSARVHCTVCDRRLSKTEVTLPAPENHYDYAVTLINRRELELARKHLLAALEKTQDSDHVHYALALCYGLQGDLAGAGVHLRRAIELQPRNRITARNDPDFRTFARKPEISEILFSERTNSG